MKPLKILLVDDDEIQRLKFKKVCNDFELKINILEAVNGENALAFLKNKKNSFDLIVSDLNMPRMNGIEFLTNLKKDSKFKNIPVVIMSTSKNKSDLKKCFNFGISGYFTKSLTFSEYSNKVTSLLEYWGKSEVVF